MMITPEDIQRDFEQILSIVEKLSPERKLQLLEDMKDPDETVEEYIDRQRRMVEYFRNRASLSDTSDNKSSL